MKENIEKMLDFLSTLTKKEADFIDCILNWKDEYKIAFLLAKKIFEEDIKNGKK